MEDRDAVSLLVEQHREIADQFRRTLDATGERRRQAFDRLRRLIAAHETAEEVLVHPRIRWKDSAGDVRARARTEEEAEIKAALAELEQVDVESPEFIEKLEALRATALAHNGAEEIDEFPVLSSALDDAQLRRLRRGIAIVERIAPTHPHPGMTLGGENVLAGGIVAVVDRMRDALSRDSD
ncbi:MAG TPA: hemerythrin domain-containing protein [Jatrophihabitans sp.]|nr:hemerythrin domain-containing protein [Jatrophihabitans sp.]